MATKTPHVLDCKVKDCAYNKDAKCHTMAITIGYEHDPMCDTFVHSSHKAGMPKVTAAVGACKMGDCKHNENLECCAEGIHVAMKDKQPDCMSFSQR